jgi:hypothetical protein
MFKKLVACCAVGFFASGAYACIVPENTAPELRQIIVHSGGYPVTDAQCAILQKNHLLLKVDGSAVVLSGANVGWVVVSLMDAKTHVVSDTVQYSTTVNTKDTASEDVAQSNFYQSLTAAIAGLDWHAAVADVARHKAAVQ